MSKKKEMHSRETRWRKYRVRKLRICGKIEIVVYYRVARKNMGRMQCPDVQS